MAVPPRDPSLDARPLSAICTDNPGGNIGRRDEPSSPAGSRLDMIPNRIHFIFGLHPDFGGKPFSFVHYLAIASAAAVNSPSEIILHHAHEPAGEWWER